VQVGYGRLGTRFWGFEEHGVVPDIVTMAKAAGNGHPFGFVVTRREVADAFASQGSFFSSVGGSPVSCAVGLAVLDTIEAEALQANAAAVGAHLTDRLAALAARHALIGTVHGHGLYQGVELVRDGASREPATHEAAALCERLLDLGVVCQPTGDYSNVLKVKPPLCITTDSADLFVDALDTALAAGW
jgi:4-aminobutyrate aminotransferase-like enzyme